MEGPAGGDAALEATLKRVVRENLGRGVARIDWIEGQLALRRFARVRLEAGHPAPLVARIDAPEDPAGRPPGGPPEPALGRAVARIHFSCFLRRRFFRSSTPPGLRPLLTNKGRILGETSRLK